jgi:hypothetical protein
MTQLWVTLSLADDDESEVLQRALRHYWDLRRREKKGGSGYFKRFRAMFRKAVKERSSLMLLELELHAVEAALKNYLDVCEREIANGQTTPFISDKAITKKIYATLEDKIERAIMSAVQTKV